LAAAFAARSDFSGLPGRLVAMISKPFEKVGARFVPRPKGQAAKCKARFCKIALQMLLLKR
jgi:hypothetical protein